jgi:hypothetical protein
MAMDYDPRDHTPMARQVLAAWVVCLGIIGLTVGLTGVRHHLAAAAAVAQPADPRAMNGVRTPRFTLCRPDPTRRSVAMARPHQGPMSLPIDRCS